MRSQPGWLIGLLILFALASAVTFGLFLYQHARDAALYDHYRSMKVQRDDLRQLSGALEKQVPPRNEQIAALRKKIEELDQMEKGLQQDVTNLLTANGATKDKLGQLYQQEAKNWTDLLAKAAAARKDLAQEEEHALAQEREFDDKRDKAREQIETLSRELEKIKREARKQNLRDDDRIAELEERIAQLTRQRQDNAKQLVSDGEIIASRATDGYVVIDRGQQHKLRRGTRFAVYNVKGGRTVIKGSIEVIDVEARIATCRVLSENDGNDPLIPGDQIHNPIYSPTAVKTFVVKGDFTAFSRDELQRFITESGARVEDELSTGTDYLVAGERTDQAVAAATNLGVTILSEQQLLEFVRPQQRFAVSKGMVFVLKGKFREVPEKSVRDFIQRNGGSIESKLRPGTHVLVVGDGAVEDIAQARLLGVTIVDQSQFAHLALGK